MANAIKYNIRIVGTTSNFPTNIPANGAKNAANRPEICTHA